MANYFIFALEKLLLQYTMEFHSYSCSRAEMNKEGGFWTQSKCVSIWMYQKASLVRVLWCDLLKRSLVGFVSWQANDSFI